MHPAFPELAPRLTWDSSCSGHFGWWRQPRAPAAAALAHITMNPSYRARLRLQPQPPRSRAGDRTRQTAAQRRRRREGGPGRSFGPHATERRATPQLSIFAGFRHSWFPRLAYIFFPGLHACSIAARLFLWEPQPVYAADALCFLLRNSKGSSSIIYISRVFALFARCVVSRPRHVSAASPVLRSRGSDGLSASCQGVGAPRRRGRGF